MLGCAPASLEAVLALIVPSVVNGTIQVNPSRDFKGFKKQLEQVEFEVIVGDDVNDSEAGKPYLGAVLPKTEVCEGMLLEELGCT